MKLNMSCPKFKKTTSTSWKCHASSQNPTSIPPQIPQYLPIYQPNNLSTTAITFPFSPSNSGCSAPHSFPPKSFTISPSLSQPQNVESLLTCFSHLPHLLPTPFLWHHDNEERHWCNWFVSSTSPNLDARAASRPPLTFPCYLYRCFYNYSTWWRVYHGFGSLVECTINSHDVMDKRGVDLLWLGLMGPVLLRNGMLPSQMQLSNTLLQTLLIMCQFLLMSTLWERGRNPCLDSWISGQWKGSSCKLLVAVGPPMKRICYQSYTGFEWNSNLGIMRNSESRKILSLSLNLNQTRFPPVQTPFSCKRKESC